MSFLRDTLLVFRRQERLALRQPAWVIMAGRVLRDVLTLVVQAAILVLVGVAFGLRAPLPAVLIGFVFIMFVAIGLASVSYATGLLVKSEDAFAPLINTLMVE